MMGEELGRQDRLFYEFCLEDVVPADHLLRKIDTVLDLGWLRGELAPYYSHTGRPSICPELMIRMLIVGYCYSIRSERRLCQEVEANLVYRWFCRLGLEDRVPDHSTFSVNRHGRFRESDILRTVFEEVVCNAMKAGLVGGEGFAVDASVIEADASRFKRIKGAVVDWTDKERARGPVREYLTALESEKPPLNPMQKPKAMSPIDPCAAWTTRGRHKVMFSYSLNYLIDMENAVILDVEATPTRCSRRSMPPRLWSNVRKSVSLSSPIALPAMSPMAPARCWAGWSSVRSNPTFPSGTRAAVMTASSRTRISLMTRRRPSMSAPRAMR